MIGPAVDSDKMFRGPAKGSIKDLLELDKSDNIGTVEKCGDKADKIVPKNSSDHDSEVDNDALETKGKKREEKLEKEIVDVKRVDLDKKNGKAGPQHPTTLRFAPQSPPVSPLTTTPSSSPSSPRTPTSPINSPAGKDKPISPFARFKQLENEQTQSSPGSRSSPTPPMPVRGTNLYRNSSMPATPRPTITHAQMANPGQSLGAVAARSGSGAKEMILMWVQNRVKDYPIPMTNFSTCWNDGLAFCALIHVFYPENFDWYSLKAENRRHNFTLAFEKAEELAGIYPLLEVDDMVRFKKPDWKCVFTYVQSFYRRFRDGRSPPKSGLTIPSHTQVALSAVAKAVAESQEAENKGKQIVAQLTKDKMETAENESKVLEKANDNENILETQTDTSSPSTDPSNTVQLEVKLAPELSAQSPTTVKEQAEDTNVSPPQVSRQELQLESCINSGNDSPLKLSPTALTSSKESWKSCRSKSVATDKAGGDEKVTRERKYSYNHPLPSEPPPIVSFNIRQ